MRLIAFLLGLSLFCPVLAEPAGRQRPANNPRPRASQPTYAHTPYIFGGKVTALTLNELSVDGKDKQGQARTMRFRLADGQKFPEGLQVGDRISVQYTTSLDSGVYSVVRCRELPDKEALPASTFPDKQ